MSDSNKKALLQVELAATIDWGEPLSKHIMLWKEMDFWFCHALKE